MTHQHNDGDNRIHEYTSFSRLASNSFFLLLLKQKNVHVLFYQMNDGDARPSLPSPLTNVGSRSVPSKTCSLPNDSPHS